MATILRPPVAPPAVPPAVPGSQTTGRRPRPLRRVGHAVRATVFWLHLLTGVVTGAVVLVMSATGTLLTFQRQFLEWSAGANPSIAPADGVALPLDSVVARARAALPAEPAVTAVTIKRDPTAPVTLALSARRFAYADRYTGEIIPASAALQTFFFETERWHRSLAQGEGLREETGSRITGASNLAFLFLIISGLVLWIPRQASGRALRAVLVPSLRARGRLRDWNWHHALGIWSAPVLFLLVLTGVFISYDWPTALLYRAFGEKQDPPRATAPARPAAAMAARTPSQPAGLGISIDSMVARGAATMPDWYSVQIRLPRDGAAPIAATVARSAWLRPDHRAAVSFARETGAMTVTPGYATLSSARRMRAWVRGTHTGEVLGPLGQLVAGLACLAAVVLVWTGIALAWRRFLRSVRRRA